MRRRVTAVLGAQWGDEGKGRIVDYMAEKDGYTLSARFQGGNNAGHTIEETGGRRTAFHLLPASALHPGMTVLLGQGMVINPEVLMEEIERVLELNPTVEIIIDPKAVAIMPWNIAADVSAEEARVGDQIGSTRRGVGPAQADRIMRVAPTIESVLKDTAWWHTHNGRVAFAESHAVINYFDNVLLAGAHGALLDLWNGDYPYVTSCSCNLDAVGPGLGISPREVTEVVGVAKAYGTRIGNGPLSSEMDIETAALVRELGREYGTTTGRPRRIGWLDVDDLERANRVNGYDYLALTHLDVFDQFEEVRMRVLDQNWKTPWSGGVMGVTTWEELPETAKRFIRVVEEAVEVPIKLISTGPQRHQIIDLR